MEVQNKILPENTIPQTGSKSWKIWILAISSLLFQSLTWASLHRALIVNPGPTQWVWTAMVAAIAISLTTFFLLVNKSRLLANSIFICSAIVYFLISPHNLYVWIG